MRTIHELLATLRSKLRRESTIGDVTTRAGGPPIITTQWGNVTESARLQAALNIRDVPAIRARVFALAVRKYGGDEAAALAHLQAAYPEAFLADEATLRPASLAAIPRSY